MLKYTEERVTFAEVPEEISLCINISNCPCHCEGCHSAYLAEDIGKELNEESLSQLIESNTGISCVAFMGGDSDPAEIIRLCEFVKSDYPNLKVAWYSGRNSFHIDIAMGLLNLDYFKVGPYIPKNGPLTSENTNQRMYQVINRGKVVDITHKFWKYETKD